ncbi:hypothetical protein JX266_006105 [Neoarthrinium moseri]|nr:hypothetical protein JX266_006105 [Neoarthrinium moseri]
MGTSKIKARRWTSYAEAANSYTGLQRTSISELINIDQDYFTRLARREEILRDAPELTARSTPVGADAVYELYQFLVRVYLPRRYPTLFQIMPRVLQNMVSGQQYPLDSPSSATLALKSIATLVDEDFIILLPSSSSAEYEVHAYLICFASGFNLPNLLNSNISELHKPLPGYAEKLQRSMNRWFQRLEVGTVVRRSNAHLRAELQHLHRLPKTKAIVLTFKTYMYPLSVLKQEGEGENLAQAIEGLSKGNVPEMSEYKGSHLWGRAVCNYLRS